MFLNGTAMSGGADHHLVGDAPLVARTTTAPRYRFHAVGGKYPALEDVGEGGAAVEGEGWSGGPTAGGRWPWCCAGSPRSSRRWRTSRSWRAGGPTGTANDRLPGSTGGRGRRRGAGGRARGGGADRGGAAGRSPRRRRGDRPRRRRGV